MDNERKSLSLCGLYEFALHEKKDLSEKRGIGMFAMSLSIGF